ncbi:MAG: RagB/SusD family nutrient uptake outer membrane protein [Bacteroidetes bacterium]|uniref:RagB/SusD family nutrient uptake outer membrane protein n=1 Tax=Candidatus Cryptobacteroides merdigallinarum TaxID=2840770 RepID=A0A9D9EHN5_9BACT|nr:RagB/SusD family nutrient uptake outer membrane protein [Candidatus Cryptobacteroides merdigallinarum]
MKLLKEISLIISILACYSCESFLTKEPLTQLSPDIVLSDYNSFKTYAWGLYDIFGETNMSIHISRQDGPLDGDCNAYLSNCKPNNPNVYQVGTYDTNNATGWKKHFDYLRRVNTMIDATDNYKGQYKDVTLSEEEKAHWRSVGFFFRAWVYADLLAKFGDVPLVVNALAEDEAYENNTRVRRDVVSERIIDDLEYARDHIDGSYAGKSYDDGDNTIDKDCVLAMLSRLCLQEATTRIYRGTDYSDTDAHPIDRKEELNQRYLKLCIESSEELMLRYPEIAPYYDELYTADKGIYGGNGLAGYPGVILYKAFAQNQAFHNHTKHQMSNSGKYQVNKQIIEMYLCRNGKPITGNDMYKGDASMFDEFSGRDRRLWMTVVPPYHVNDNTLQENYVHFDVPSTNLGMLSKGLTYYRSINPEYNVYIDSIGDICRQYMKMLPCTNWSGNVVENMPNLYYAKTNSGVNGSGTIGYVYSSNGYTFWKYVNSWTDVSTNKNFNDIPIFHIEEIMLNYAEAKWESGQFDQTVADATINKLRARQNVQTAPMLVNEINESFDPARDPSVDPVLWEIRRERIMELLGDGFGFNDIKRWGTAKWFVATHQTGCGVTLTDATSGSQHSYGLEPGIFLVDGNNYKVGKAGDSGYVFVDYVQVPGWNDKYYLEPIDYSELLLDPDLNQNPGYSK